MGDEIDESARAKIRIPLRGSALESGYESESVWADRLGNHLYRVWNVPALAYNVEMTAVVECDEVPGDLPKLIRVVETGSCHGVRLYFSEAAPDEAVQAVLDLVGSRKPVTAKCGQRLWTAGFRSVEDYEWLGRALKEHIEAGTVRLDSVFQPSEPAW